MGISSAFSRANTTGQVLILGLNLFCVWGLVGTFTHANHIPHKDGITLYHENSSVHTHRDGGKNRVRMLFDDPDQCCQFAVVNGSNSLRSCRGCDFSGRSEIRFYNDGIELVEGSVFEGATGIADVTDLYLETSDIQEIQQGAFQNLTSLKYLFLKYNQVHEIQRDTFQGLTSLRGLYLRENRIQEMQRDAFQSLTNLETLDLGHIQSRRSSGERCKV